MSLMTDTQGTPERVWSLINLLLAHGGQLEREGIAAWLDPLDTDTKGTAVGNTLGAASSLDLIERSGTLAKLRAIEFPESFEGFSDGVHDKLVETPTDHANSIVLETLAWFIVNSARQQGTTWIQESSTDELVNRIRHDLSGASDDGRFNKTRYPRWRDWMGFLGVGIDIPAKPSALFYPYVTQRMVRSIGTWRTQLGTGTEVPAEDFLRTVINTMPYLDGGDLFTEVATRIQWACPPRQLSVVFSTALRELQEDGLLELKMVGDAPNPITLHPDPTQKTQAFIAVILKEKEENNG